VNYQRQMGLLWQLSAVGGRRSVRVGVAVALATIALPVLSGAAVAAPPSGNGGGGGTSATSSTPSFTVSLVNGRSVQVDNWSAYSKSALTSLVQWADRGMATTDPLNVKAAGEMETGDRIVVTDYGIYWLDLMRRGGLLSGIWPITATSTGVKFEYTPSGDEWEPNELLPGSDPGGQSSADNLYAGGQQLNVIAYGTDNADGSCTPGYGTFVMNDSDNCGVADTGVSVSLSVATLSGGVHAYSVSGTLYQEGTNHDQTMIDGSGQQAQIGFLLTYDFGDTTDTTTDYGSGGGAGNQRVRTELTLTPSGPIDLGTLVVADTSDWGSATYPLRQYNYSNTARTVYAPGGMPCISGTALAPFAVGNICEAGTYASNWISQPNSISSGTHLSGGDFVTEMQTSSSGSITDRELTALVPETGSYQFPERIDHIWNAGLQVSSMDVDYFNDESFPVASGGALNLGYDLQTVPYS
jgi:hypothetical protein